MSVQAAHAPSDQSTVTTAKCLPVDRAFAATDDAAVDATNDAAFDAAQCTAHQSSVYGAHVLSDQSTIRTAKLLPVVSSYEGADDAAIDSAFDAANEAAKCTS